MAETWLMREDAAKALNDGNAPNVINLEAERSARVPRKHQDEHPADTPTIAGLKEHLATLRAAIAKVEALAEQRRSELAAARKRTDHRVAELTFLAKFMSEMTARADRAARPWWRRTRMMWHLARFHRGTGGILASNPATSVRGPKHVIKHGKPPVLTTDQARALIESIDTSTLVGLRDRALIGVMTYAFARVGAVVAMRVEDYFANGKRWWVRLHEKNAVRCRPTTSSKPSSTNTSAPLASAISQRAPSSAPFARSVENQFMRALQSPFPQRVHHEGPDRDGALARPGLEAADGVPSVGALPDMQFAGFQIVMPVIEAGAYTAYVSNEKSNTISVIDTATWKVVETIKVGQRPRGITFTKDTPDNN
jgi:YVTN family beta-propeller protein